MYLWFINLFHLLFYQPSRFLAVFPELCIMETRFYPGLFTSMSPGKRPFPLFSVVYSEHGSKENALHRGREERRTEMIGAIVGDIVGSVYEWNNIKTKDFPLFREDCFFTDDTIMTCAVAEAIMEGGTRDAFIDAMKKYGRMYPDAGYGGRFGAWLRSDSREPYNSFGNGSAMRVSPCAWVMDCGFCARTGMWPTVGRNRATLSAQVTHDHPEGVKGAAAVADAIFMCRYHFGGWHGEYERPSATSPSSARSTSGNTSSGNIAMTCPGRWTRSGRAISSTRPARKPFPRPSSPFWRAGTSRMPSATPSPWAATATPWPPSQEASPRRHTESPIGLRKRPSPIWTFPCWM